MLPRCTVCVPQVQNLFDLGADGYLVKPIAAATVKHLWRYVYPPDESTQWLQLHRVAGSGVIADLPIAPPPLRMPGVASVPSGVAATHSSEEGFPSMGDVTGFTVGLVPLADLGLEGWPAIVSSSGDGTEVSSSVSHIGSRGSGDDASSQRAAAGQSEVPSERSHPLEAHPSEWRASTAGLRPIRLRPGEEDEEIGGCRQQ